MGFDFDTLVIDGNNIANRCWKSMPMLTTSKGKQVSTIFGVLKTVRSAVEFYKPKSVNMTWDGKPAARLSIYPQYKEKRKQAKQEFTPAEQEEYRQFNIQCDELKDILPFFGIHQYKGPEIEADDLVAELSRKNKSLILSEDKDFLQMVSESIKVFRPITNALYTLKNFEEMVGLPNPAMYLQARLIMGDKSDDIPGVPGFKEGRVFPLILEHKTAGKAISAAKQAKGKLMETLAGSKEIIIRNALLMDLQFSPEYIPGELEDYREDGKFDEKEIKDAMLKLEFFSYMKNLTSFISPFQRLI